MLLCFSMEKEAKWNGRSGEKVKLNILSANNVNIENRWVLFKWDNLFGVGWLSFIHNFTYDIGLLKRVGVKYIISSKQGLVA